MKQIEFIVTLEQTDVITDSENKRVTVNIESKGARPLIHCGECKHSKPIDSDWLECQHDKRVNKPHGFCSWAEPEETNDAPAD